MARKLEDILKTQGYTDADIEALKPLLTDAKFRAAVETAADTETLTSELEKVKKENETWADWHQRTAIPTLDKALKAEQDAKADLGAANARLQALQDQGLIKVAEGEGEPVAKKPPESTFDPKAHNLVTITDVQAFAEKEGDAIALAQDIAEESRRLGISIPSFREMRKAAVAAGKPVEQYWQDTYKVVEKRDAKTAQEKADYEKSIREDERKKAISEFANPLTRPPSASAASFIPRPASGGKQPWEDDPNARASARVEKALTKVLQ